ncbi:DUF4920 domain-containing protein [Roseivirga thermotolerans]|jgi:hypothetical protein|uniref:DUF4920 domain-containing protein n=1 Tax=Roseivirga thermotolerans TaxID=1758176 RepID=A0ABQ3I2K5_9BACT|nr:DUF4920 domain-containing protein [Roseivirga thermotolerans]GHE52166.1 hypothetical protein GCM10011340_03000 [Roseivirga thermotolerans]
MKKIFLAVVMLATVWACADKKTEQTEVKADKADVVGTYGAEISEEGAISVESMMAKLETSDSVMVKVKGEITATCAMKGCWMNLVLPNGEEMRVTFKDYGFFVPKEGMEGNYALIEGVVTRTLTDVETLKHYAADAGKPEEEILAITEPKDELSFVANGVIIYKGEQAASE